MGLSPPAPSPQLDQLLAAAAIVTSEALSEAVATLAIATAPVPRSPAHATGVGGAGGSGDEAGDVDDDEPPEQRAFLCDACGKTRELLAREVDLDAVEACGSWTCAGGSGDAGDSGGNERLRARSLAARGGCAAPSDDLVRLLGSEAAAAACDAVGLASPLAVASARIPDDDDVLYCGAEGALPASYARVNGFARLAAALTVSVDDDGDDGGAGGGGGGGAAGATAGGQRGGSTTAASWAERLSQRLACAPLLTRACALPACALLAPAPAGAAGAAVPSGGSPVAAPPPPPPPVVGDPRALLDFAPVRLEYAHTGQKLVHAAALLLLLSTPGSGALLVGVPPGAPPPTAGALASAAASPQLAAAAGALLRAPLGWLVAAALARSWQQYARFDVLDEWMSALLVSRAADEGREGDPDEVTGLPAPPPSLLGGGEEDSEEGGTAAYAAREATAGRVKAALERLRLCAPLELARTPLEVLHRLLQDEGLAAEGGGAAASSSSWGVGGEGGPSPERPAPGEAAAGASHGEASHAAAAASPPSRAAAPAAALPDSSDADAGSRGAAGHATGATADASITLPDVQLWLARARRLLAAQPWLQDVVIA